MGGAVQEAAGGGAGGAAASWMAAARRRSVPATTSVRLGPRCPSHHLRPLEMVVKKRKGHCRTAWRRDAPSTVVATTSV